MKTRNLLTTTAIVLASTMLSFNASAGSVNGVQKGNDNIANIEQVGGVHVVNFSQNGFDDLLTVNQIGSGGNSLTSLQDQDSERNSLYVIQDSTGQSAQNGNTASVEMLEQQKDSTVTISQKGGLNNAKIISLVTWGGRGANDTNVSQIGNANSVYYDSENLSHNLYRATIVQEGDFNRMHAGGDNHDASQIGDNNRLEAWYAGDGVFQQIGNNNQASLIEGLNLTVQQVGNDNLIESSLSADLTVVQYGNANIVDSEGGDVSIDQTGNDNSARSYYATVATVVQHGNANLVDINGGQVSINQTGNGNLFKASNF